MSGPWRRDPRGHDRPLPRGRRRGHCAAHGVRQPSGLIGGTRHQRLPVARATGPAFIVPVYDYVLMTEPLSAAQMASIGWEGRQGLASTGNQFIYYRLTGDNRILFGGYDAVYYYGGAMGPAYEQRGDTFERLATLFAETFPNSTMSPSPTRGREPSTPARGSAPSSARPPRAASPTAPATPASEWGPAGSVHASCSTCSRDARASSPSSPWCGPNPSPSRPNRFAGRASGSPVGPSPAPTDATGAATSGSARSTGPAWGSTPECADMTRAASRPGALGCAMGASSKSAPASAIVAPDGRSAAHAPVTRAVRGAPLRERGGGVSDGGI